MSHMRLSLPITACALLAFAHFASHGFGQDNTITFDNQSGQPALVKLVGPTTKDVEVATGARSTIEAAAGRYHIKVRYGSPRNYRYTRGEEFAIEETRTTRSNVTITLHKVLGGNYNSWSIPDADFESPPKQNASELAKTSPMPVKATDDAKVQLREAIFDDTIDAGVSVDAVKIVALQQEVAYAGLIRTEPPNKVLQISATIKATKPRICLGSRTGKRENEDCAPFGAFIVCADLKDTTVISTALTVGAFKLQKTKAPDGHLNLVALGDGPFSWDVDVFFVIPAEATNVKFKFGTGPSKPVLLQLPTEK